MPSTVIANYSYDAEQQILRIGFVSGLVYQYKDVPGAVYRAMKAFREKGVFFNTQIKGKFEFEKLEPEQSRPAKP